MKDWEIIEFIYLEYSKNEIHRVHDWIDYWDVADKYINYDWGNTNQVYLIEIFVKGAKRLYKLRLERYSVRPNLGILWRKEREIKFKNKILSKINRYRQKYWIWKIFELN